MAASDDVLSELRKLHPLLIDLSLERIQRLLGRLGSPERRLPPVIHVAGTNGKGSVVAFLKTILEAAGRRVHVYTSPHLVRFRERIALAGPSGIAHPIDERALVDVLQRVAQVNAGESITFFEITTAAAFLAFAETTADFVLLEVGLGGRFDATNVVERPALTIITQIAMDHADKLGHTIESIAAEKAGIMKLGTPCILAQQSPAAAQALDAAASRVGAPLICWGKDFDAFEQRGRFVFQQDDRLLDLPLPGLIGPHQIVNAGVAVAASLALASSGVNEGAISQGLADVRWPARMQRLGPGPLSDSLPNGFELWLDGGHNPAAGRAIAQTLADLEERAPRPLHLIAGMMGQKDAAKFFEPFRGLVRSVVTVPIPGAHEKPFTPEALAAEARQCGLDAQTADNVPEALSQLLATADGPLRIVICGSLYLAGHVLALQEGVTPQMN